jgi:hypothetical protein
MSATASDTWSSVTQHLLWLTRVCMLDEKYFARQKVTYLLTFSAESVGELGLR